MKLDADPRAILVPQRHDLTFRTVGRDGKFCTPFLRQAHNQRMVTAHTHGVGNARKQPRSVMHDFRNLAVHDTRPDDNLSSAGKTQRLMTKTDAEHRNLRFEQAQHLHAVSGIFRPPWPRRKANHFQGRVLRHLRQARIVIFDDNRGAPQRVKSLHQIVGKRIVIIDEQEHDLPPKRQGQRA